MGDEVLEQKFNKSHRASANPPGMGREKSLRYDPPVRCQVRVGLRMPVSTRRVEWVCECWGWVSMIEKVEFIQFRPHRHHHMDMLVDTLLWTCIHIHVHMCHPHIQRHRLPPNTSLFAPHPLPPTLPHTHKICLNYPGVLSPACLPILLFFQKVFFLSFCCARIAYHCFQVLMLQLCLQVFFSLSLFTRLFYTVKDCVLWQGPAW